MLNTVQTIMAPNVRPKAKNLMSRVIVLEYKDYAFFSFFRLLWETLWVSTVINVGKNIMQ